jgi:hypothetical protein
MWSRVECKTFSDVSAKPSSLVFRIKNSDIYNHYRHCGATLCGITSKKNVTWIFMALKITNIVHLVLFLHISLLSCNRIFFSTENSETELSVYGASTLVLRRCRKNVLVSKPDNRLCESFLFTVVIRPTQSLICSTVSRTSACCYVLPPTSFTNFT